MRVSRLVLPFLALIAAPTIASDPYYQCAAFARQFSGIEIRGDAWTWWGLAEGKYQRGSSPRVGAVMAFIPGGNMRLGHVATVTAIRGPRELTITHANWSPIDGRRGRIEHDVLVRDVSDANDWSRVRVWYAPISDLGTTSWGIDGFIYPDRVRGSFARDPQFAHATTAPKLAYARLDTLKSDAPVTRALLGADVIRLAALEARRPR